MKLQYKKILLAIGLLTIAILAATVMASAQTVGKTTTEQYKASFETKIDISQYMDYSGPTIPIQI